MDRQFFKSACPKYNLPVRTCPDVKNACSLYLLDDVRTRSINLFNKWCRCQLGRRRLYSWHGCRSLIYFCPNCSYSLICVDIWRRNFRCIHLEHNRIVEKKMDLATSFLSVPFSVRTGKGQRLAVRSLHGAACPFGQAVAKDWLSDRKTACL